MADRKDLGAAYGLKKASKRKQMAKGGVAKNESASTETRPMPQERDKDAGEIARNSSIKPALHDGALDRITVEQAQSNNGRKVKPIKHPRMVDSDRLQVRLRDEEDHLMSSAAVNDGPQQQPRKIMDEEGADRQGPSVPALKMKKMAQGGIADDEIEARERADEAHMQSRLSPSEDEGASNAHSRNEERPNRQGPSTSSLKMKMMAEGGSIEEEREIMEEDSLAAAIMAKRERARQRLSDSDMDEMQRLYDGGEVNGHDSLETHEDIEEADLARNAEEDANMEDRASYDALRKEIYDESSALEELDSPKDSNRHGHSIDSDEHDRVEDIHRKMMARRQFKQR